MTDKYDNNGYNSSDFKRNSNKMEDHDAHEQDGEGSRLNEKASDYMRELLSEKVKLNLPKFPITSTLIDEEVNKVQNTGRIPIRDPKYVDVCHEKSVKVSVRVLVPIKEHPKFNFVGKLLGPKGNTMKQLQEETMCKMAILGRGSMRDKKKEEELRMSMDPKYAHLTDELHVEISALAPPAEAHARIAYALAEIKKYLIPDAPDMIRPAPMRDMMDRGHPIGQHPMGPPPGRAPPRMPPAPPPPRRGRPLAGKTKVISILDRARTAMESSYSYEDPYGAPEPPVRGPPRAAPEEFYYDRGQERFYEDEPYYKEEREYKPAARDVGTRRPGPARGGFNHGQARGSPYARPTK